MSNTGRLGAIAPAATTYKTLYKPGSGLVAGGLVITVCNAGSSDDKIRIAASQNASADPTPNAADFLFYDHIVKAKSDATFADTIQITGICLANLNNDQLVVYSTNGTSTSFVVTGIEEAA